jgi:hypothetical protein
MLGLPFDSIIGIRLGHHVCAVNPNLDDQTISQWGRKQGKRICALSPRVGPWTVIPSNGVTRGKLEEVRLRALVSSFATRFWTFHHHHLLLYIRKRFSATSFACFSAGEQVLPQLDTESISAYICLHDAQPCRAASSSETFPMAAVP